MFIQGGKFNTLTRITKLTRGNQQEKRAKKWGGVLFIFIYKPKTASQLYKNADLIARSLSDLTLPGCKYSELKRPGSN